MNIRIKLEGLDNVLGKLDKLAGGADRGLKKGLLRGGELVRAEAAANCPVDTARLRESIVVQQKSGNSVTIGPTAEYGIYVEFGTGSKGDPSVSHTTKSGWFTTISRPADLYTQQARPRSRFWFRRCTARRKQWSRRSRPDYWRRYNG